MSEVTEERYVESPLLLNPFTLSMDSWKDNSLSNICPSINAASLLEIPSNWSIAFMTMQGASKSQSEPQPSFSLPNTMVSKDFIIFS